MMLVINESTFLLNRFLKTKKTGDNIKFVSTKGFLFDYLKNGKKIKIMLKDPLLVKFLKSFDKKDNIIIVASDHDPAGHLIALEILSLFKKATVLRFQNQFEVLFKIPDDSISVFLQRNSFDKFKIGIPGIYLKDRLYGSEYREKRLFTLAAFLYGGNLVKKIKIKGNDYGNS